MRVGRRGGAHAQPPERTIAAAGRTERRDKMMLFRPNRAMRTPVAGVCGVVVGTALMIVQIGCAGPTRLTRYEFTRQAMGGRAEIVLYARTRNEAVAAAGGAFERIQHLDSVLSDYRAQSELMPVCERAGTVPVVASDDLNAVLGVGGQIQERMG